MTPGTPESLLKLTRRDWISTGLIFAAICTIGYFAIPN